MQLRPNQPYKSTSRARLGREATSKSESQKEDDINYDIVGAKLNYSGRDTVEPWENPFAIFCGFFLKLLMLQCGHMYSSPSVFA